jgi:hypothetical protein
MAQIGKWSVLVTILAACCIDATLDNCGRQHATDLTLYFLARSGRTACVEDFHTEFAKAALIFQSTSVTKPAMNDLPFAADGTEIENFRLFFL